MRGIAGFIAVAYFFTALGAAPLDGDESSRIPRDPAARQARDCGTAQVRTSSLQCQNLGVAIAAKSYG